MRKKANKTVSRRTLKKLDKKAEKVDPDEEPKGKKPLERSTMYESRGGVAGSSNVGTWRGHPAAKDKKDKK
jgi:hypothetical protein